MSTVRRLRPALAAALLTGILVIAGCSSSDDSASTTSNATGTSASATGSVASGADSSATSPATGSSDPGAAPTEAAAPSSEAPSSQAPAPATTPVPPPGGGGDINQTVPSVQLTTAAPVSLSQTADFGGGVTVDLASIESVTTTAQGPGEVAGPGLVIKIRIKNGSAAAVPLDAVNVTVSDGAQTPASPMSGPPAAPFSGNLAPGAEATGVYVFTLPGGYTNPATVTVSYSTAAPIVVFTGNAT